MPNENESGSQNPEPKYVTADEIGNVVNAAVTSHLKRSLSGAIAEAMKPLQEKLTALTTQPEPPQGEGESKKSKQQSPELLAMAQKVEQMEKALADERQRVAAAEEKQRKDRAFHELRASLEGKVQPALLDLVASHLFVVQDRVSFDDSGTPLFKSSRAPYAGADPEEVQLPLKAGIEDFLKSDAAKPFLPAPNPGAAAGPLPKRGSSPAPTGTDFSKPATSDADKARRAAERERVAIERLKQR